METKSTSANGTGTLPPPSTSPEMKENEPTMGPISAIFYVAGGIIGAGIFATPSVVLNEVKSIGVALLLWVVGGLASMCGALSYVEWGQMFPGKAGGDQVYLLYGYPRPRALVAFLFSWSGIFLIRPAYGAAISTLAVKYMLLGIFGTKETVEREQPNVFQHWDILNKGAAVLVVTLIHTVNAISVKAAIRINNALSFLKLTVLAICAMTGLLVLMGAIKHIEKTDNFSHAWDESTTNPGSYVSALFAIFYVFEGWNYINYCAGDLKDPVKNLPRGSIGGMLICIFFYMLVNIAFLAVVPYPEFLKARELLGSTFASKVFGTFIGEKIVPFLIGFAAYGSCSVVVFSSARILQTAAAQGMVPKPHIFQQENKRLGTPINALILNWCITVLLICAPPGGKAFTFLLALAAYPAWIFYGLSLLGLILFRRFQPNWPRPYRVWLIAPIVVICMSSFLAIFPFLGEDWLSSLVGLSVLLLAVPVYYLIRNRFTIEELEFEDDARAAEERYDGKRRSKLADVLADRDTKQVDVAVETSEK
ncbi:b(0,+)-type amino acid transporter 1 [Quaeritorhiza haematococci]|nr:b(0,+)-type amino acid transporter 1 [Quaeritorhiza haematococci]